MWLGREIVVAGLPPLSQHIFYECEVFGKIDRVTFYTFYTHQSANHICVTYCTRYPTSSLIALYYVFRDLSENVRKIIYGK